jgi:hypothetical protein
MTFATRRIAIVLLALVVAYAAASLLITLCMFLEWEETLRASGTQPVRLAVGIFGLIASPKMLLVTFVAIVLAEHYRIRWVALYAVVAAVAFGSLAFDLGVPASAPSSASLIGREREILIGAGMAAGLVYWAVAGRNAGAWRDTAVASHE